MVSMLIAILLVSDSLTISPVGFTFHGVAPNEAAQKHMPYKLSSDGRWTFHPSIGIHYKNGHFQTAAWYFKDSFGNSAGGLLAGYNLPISKYFNIGILGGPYIRKSESNINKFPISYKTDKLEIVPLVLLNASVAIPITKKIYLETGVSGNYAVNFFTTGVRLDF